MASSCPVECNRLGRLLDPTLSSRSTPAFPRPARPTRPEPGRPSRGNGVKCRAVPGSAGPVGAKLLEECRIGRWSAKLRRSGLWLGPPGPLPLARPPPARPPGSLTSTTFFPVRLATSRPRYSAPCWHPPVFPPPDVGTVALCSFFRLRLDCLSAENMLSTVNETVRTPRGQSWRSLALLCVVSFCRFDYPDLQCGGFGAATLS